MPQYEVEFQFRGDSEPADLEEVLDRPGKISKHAYQVEAQDHILRSFASSLGHGFISEMDGYGGFLLRSE